MNESLLNGHLKHFSRKLKGSLETANTTKAGKVITDTILVEGAVKNNPGVIIAYDKNPFNYLVDEVILRNRILPILDAPEASGMLQDMIVDDLRNVQNVKFKGEAPTVSVSAGTAASEGETSAPEAAKSTLSTFDPEPTSPPAITTATQRVKVEETRRVTNIGLITDDDMPGPHTNTSENSEEQNGKRDVIKEMKETLHVEDFNWKKWGSIAAGILLFVLAIVAVRWSMHHWPSSAIGSTPNTVWVMTILAFIGIVLLICAIATRSGALMWATVAIFLLVTIWTQFYHPVDTVVMSEKVQTTTTPGPVSTTTTKTESTVTAPDVNRIEQKQADDHKDIDNLKTRVTDVEQDTRSLKAQVDTHASRINTLETKRSVRKAWVDKDGYPLTARRYTKHQLVPQKIVR